MLKAETSDGDQQFLNRYAKWQERYNRTYEDNKEWEYRLGVYKSNVEYIEYVNSQNLSYKLVDNKFADMTNLEFTSIYASCVLSDLTTKGNLTRNKSKLEDLPAEVDWRKSGAVAPVITQGICGKIFKFFHLILFGYLFLFHYDDIKAAIPTCKFLLKF